MSWAKGKSGGNPADVYYDFVPYSDICAAGDSSDGSSVSGYAEGKYDEMIFTDGGRLWIALPEKPSPTDLWSYVEETGNVVTPLCEAVS